MTSLFLDTSAYIQIGLLDDGFHWLHYELIKNKKGSQVLHGLIYNVLKEKGIKIKDIDRLIVANGPGSYTGIRLAEGFSQILELESISIINFYHFETPQFFGCESYTYGASAFKKEIFIYERDGNHESRSLVSEESFLALSESKSIFHIGDSLEGKNLESLYNYYEKEPQRIFKQIVERGTRCEPFYFRPLEKEFKVSNP